MRVVAVYKEKSDHARAMEEFLHDFKHRTGRDIEVINPESVKGDAFCRAYDIVIYPTVIAIADNSSMQQMWQGLPLPTIMEVSYYV